MLSFGYDMDDLYREAQHRWLKPPEVLYILQNHQNYQLSHEAPQLPSSGSLFLFNRRVLRYFRKDGHNWRKKRDQRTVGEAHERLKVGNAETLNCYYAHGEQTPNFQRRSYWMLDPASDHIVLVHYRDINEGKSSPSSKSIASSFLLSPSETQSSHSSQNQVYSSKMNGLNGSNQDVVSPGEVSSSEVVCNNNVLDHLQTTHGGENTSFKEGLRRLKEQLSLNDDTIKEVEPLFIEDECSNSARYLDFRGESEMAKNIQQPNFMDKPEYSASYQSPSENSVVQDYLSDYIVFQGSDENRATIGNHDLLSEMLEQWSEPLPSIESELQEKLGYQWPNTTSVDQGEVETSAYYQMLLDQSIPPEAPIESLNVPQMQRYTIQDISPPWGYSSDTTKVIIIGSFLCDPTEFSWKCMFGDIEVPVEIIQNGVLRCEAPPCLPGKATLCVTTGNHQSCSEVREFEYRAKSDICTRCKSAPSEAPESKAELLHLARFVQMLLHDSAEEDTNSCNHVIEALLDDTGSSTQTYSSLLTALLKDKLHQWLSVRSKEGTDQLGCSLSRGEQGIIHMVAALGFEWALNPILGCGVNVNFRDVSGWTALHWAAQFGREKMVAALIASGAFAGAVTDPTAMDPTGKTAASIAATCGHKGLAGYLSEVSLTSYLSSLTIEESELSKDSAEFEAERTVNSISEVGQGHLSSHEEQLSLKDTMDAVRNSVHAAARIQSAFRAHSFRKRQERELAGGAGDDYVMSSNDIHAMSRLALRGGRDYNLAALSIQKKYRGWNDRRKFLSLRQKVVKIQAHVRGHQVRKHYKVICWAVGVLDMAVLRWRRKGVGLRNFRDSTNTINEKEDEDILKVFRKQKVDGAIDKAVSRVFSMVKSPVAQQQYRRMLESYRQAKAQLDSISSEASPSTSGDFANMMASDDFPNVEIGGDMYSLP